jgi:hypothetical protein
MWLLRPIIIPNMKATTMPNSIIGNGTNGTLTDVQHGELLFSAFTVILPAVGSLH